VAIARSNAEICHPEIGGILHVSFGVLLSFDDMILV
jgi:hypothetical protein